MKTGQMLTAEYQQIIIRGNHTALTARFFTKNISVCIRKTIDKNIIRFLEKKLFVCVT